MKKSASIIILLLAMLSGSFSASAQSTSLSTIDWSADLRYLIEQLDTIHPNPYARIGEDTFRNRSAQLFEIMNNHTDEEIAVELMQLVASLQDGHTYLEPTGPKGFSLWFPVHFYRFSDAYYITLIDREFERYTGALVLEIGKMVPEKAHELTASLKGSDNEYGYLENVHYLSNAIALHTLGVIESLKELPLKVKLNGGEITTITLQAFKQPFSLNWRFWGEMFGPINGEDNRTRYVSAFDGLLPLDYRTRIETLPLHLRNRIPYWFEYIKDNNTIYFQFNFVEREWQGEKFSEFYKRMFSFADSVEARHLIIDIRYNSGGDGSILIPFVHEIIKRDRINRPGHLITLVGRKTYSAAVMLVDYLKDHTNTIFVGEPPGSALNHYGDATSVTLPNSGYTLSISTLYHQLSTSDDVARVESIHFPSQFSGADYFSGIDPALDEVLANLPYLPIIEVLKQNGAMAALERFKQDRNRYKDYTWWRPFDENKMNSLGYDLLEMDRLEDAVGAFEINAEVYPDSWNVWDSLAETYFKTGDKELALKTYERSLVLNPHNDHAKQMIEQIRKTLSHSN